jgi:hypothetical protein
MPDLAAVLRLLQPRGWFIAELPRNGLYRKTAHLIFHLSGGHCGWLLGQICTPGAHQLPTSEHSNAGALLVLVSGVSLVARHAGGLYWLPAAIVGLLLAAFLMSWRLVLGVSAAPGA